MAFRDVDKFLFFIYLLKFFRLNLQKVFGKRDGVHLKVNKLCINISIKYCNCTMM
jgi:hypothetical protein